MKGGGGRSPGRQVELGQLGHGELGQGLGRVWRGESEEPSGVVLRRGQVWEGGIVLLILKIRQG